jgi:hypothetical protein
MSLHITRKVLFDSVEAGKTYFHPKATLVPRFGRPPLLLMTLQSIGGSDYFGPVEVTRSNDCGECWSSPAPLPALGRHPFDAATTEGVCDVVPDFHAATGKVLAIGHNVFYRNNQFFDTHGDFRPGQSEHTYQRCSVYSIGEADGQWSPRQRITWPEFDDCSSFVCGCTQKVLLPDGEILIPVSIGHWGRRDRMFCTLLCDFDGRQITVRQRGDILEWPTGRGLLEPSLVRHQGKTLVTLRAEDNRGYCAWSEDGLRWRPPRAWAWEDGDTLEMSTTQQHWLALGDRLYLLYTRKTPENAGVMRWRSPLFMAEVDADALCLRRDTEQVVLPMRGDPAQPRTVALMGNFMPLALSATEAIVLDGDFLPYMGYSGQIQMARITI